MTQTMKLQLMGIVALVGLEVCGTIGAATAAPQNEKMPVAKKTSRISKADKKFVMEAAMGGMAEVQLGELASKKAASDGVKQFGQKMVEDHSAANEKLKSIVSGKGINLPADVGTKNKATIARLSKLSGAAFDSAYIKDMVTDHRMDIKEFTKASMLCKDPDIKGFASSTLPTLKEHYQMITAMQSGKGKMGSTKMKMNHKSKM